MFVILLHAAGDICSHGVAVLSLPKIYIDLSLHFLHNLTLSVLDTEESISLNLRLLDSESFGEFFEWLLLSGILSSQKSLKISPFSDLSLGIRSNEAVKIFFLYSSDG